MESSGNITCDLCECVFVQVRKYRGGKKRIKRPADGGRKKKEEKKMGGVITAGVRVVRRGWRVRRRDETRPPLSSPHVSFPQHAEVKSRNVSRWIAVLHSVIGSLSISPSHFLSCPLICPFCRSSAGHWRSLSSRYRYSNVKPSFFRWPHFS